MEPLPKNKVSTQTRFREILLVAVAFQGSLVSVQHLGVHGDLLKVICLSSFSVSTVAKAGSQEGPTVKPT